MGKKKKMLLLFRKAKPFVFWMGPGYPWWTQHLVLMLQMGIRLFVYPKSLVPNKVGMEPILRFLERLKIGSESTQIKPGPDPTHLHPNLLPTSTPVNWIWTRHRYSYFLLFFLMVTFIEKERTVQVHRYSYCLSMNWVTRKTMLISQHSFPAIDMHQGQPC